MAKEIALLAAEEKRELLTAALAARLLGKSRDTIYRWLGEGRLAGRKVGGRWLVYRDAVEAEWQAGVVEREKTNRG
ncbi:MAG: helix-turn-helix domain-containing protein [Acidobacteria bacterium]|nr:helix-turn-helix domain-containing protein [Acidobacteriota bacterium]